ncbi:MAG: hypothetical protein HOY75_08055 [Streptomyces sp.]|nr:hypothetical protein [Streptomyces sp.]
MNPFNVHTEHNAVPNVDGTALGYSLADLTGIHPGLDLIADGLRLIAHDRLTTAQTQLILVALAGSADSSDLLAAVGQSVARLTDSDTNPALRTLPFDQQSIAFKEGYSISLELTDTALREITARANAALDTH